MRTDNGFHYSILFVPTDKQTEVLKVFELFFPKERGSAFAPMREHWRRDRKEIEKRLIFPGYIFVCTDMNRLELHEFVKTHRIVADTYIKELVLHAPLMTGVTPTCEENECLLGDLTEEESSFFEEMLDDDGILKMSVGYMQDGWAVITSGPLAGREELLYRVDRHNRIATLTQSFRGIRMTAGLEIKPKEEG